jgi:hypothetical protein
MKTSIRRQRKGGKVSDESIPQTKTFFIFSIDRGNFSSDSLSIRERQKGEKFSSSSGLNAALNLISLDALSSNSHFLLLYAIFQLKAFKPMPGKQQTGEEWTLSLR